MQIIRLKNFVDKPTSCSLYQKKITMFNVTFIDEFYASQEADELFSQLKLLQFNDLALNIQGKTVTPRRKVLSFGDATYSFSGASMQPEPWTPLMLRLKADVEKSTGHEYNHALLNFYPDGLSGIGAHRDNERSVDKKSGVVCVSFGATRSIIFKSRAGESVSRALPHGCLYHMMPPTNQLFTHQIDVQPDVMQCRISVSFRLIKESLKRTLPVEDTVKRQCVDSPATASPTDSCLILPATASSTVTCDTPLPDFMLSSPATVPSTVSASPTDSCLIPSATTSIISPTVSALDPCYHIPSGDWLDQHISAMCPPEEIIEAWRLGFNTFVSVHFAPMRGTRIHIRAVKDDGHLSKRGVVMLPATWSCFIEKLGRHNTVYVNSSFIANNQLAVFTHNHTAVLQQIFPAKETPYNFRPVHIRLVKEQLEMILEKRDEIDQQILKTLFNQEIRRGLQRIHPANPTPTNEDSEFHFFNAMFSELSDSVHTLYECEGCLWDHPSQTRHQCMSLPMSLRYATIGEKALFHMRSKNIIEKLNKRLQYTNLDLSLDNIRREMRLRM